MLGVTLTKIETLRLGIILQCKLLFVSVGVVEVVLYCCRRIRRAFGLNGLNNFGRFIESSGVFPLDVGGNCKFKAGFIVAVGVVVNFTAVAVGVAAEVGVVVNDSLSFGKNNGVGCFRFLAFLSWLIDVDFDFDDMGGVSSSDIFVVIVPCLGDLFMLDDVSS